MRLLHLDSEAHFRRTMVYASIKGLNEQDISLEPPPKASVPVYDLKEKLIDNWHGTVFINDGQTRPIALDARSLIEKCPLSRGAHDDEHLC